MRTLILFLVTCSVVVGQELSPIYQAARAVGARSELFRSFGRNPELYNEVIYNCAGKGTMGNFVSLTQISAVRQSYEALESIIQLGENWRDQHSEQIPEEWPRMCSRLRNSELENLIASSNSFFSLIFNVHASHASAELYEMAQQNMNAEVSVARQMLNSLPSISELSSRLYTRFRNGDIDGPEFDQDLRLMRNFQREVIARYRELERRDQQLARRDEEERRQGQVVEPRRNLMDEFNRELLRTTGNRRIRHINLALNENFWNLSEIQVRLGATPTHAQMAEYIMPVARLIAHMHTVQLNMIVNSGQIEHARRVEDTARLRAQCLEARLEQIFDLMLSTNQGRICSGNCRATENTYLHPVRSVSCDEGGALRIENVTEVRCTYDLSRFQDWQLSLRRAQQGFIEQVTRCVQATINRINQVGGMSEALPNSNISGLQHTLTLENNQSDRNTNGIEERNLDSELNETNYRFDPYGARLEQ